MLRAENLGIIPRFSPIVTQFISSVNHAKSFCDVWIDSAVNVGAYWRGQKMLSSINPNNSGSTMKWQWTLPNNFPPGKYLRVKVDGGTLTPDGNPIPWDNHGYYEIALDAGSLSLSP